MPILSIKLQDRIRLDRVIYDGQDEWLYGCKFARIVKAWSQTDHPPYATADVIHPRNPYTGTEETVSSSSIASNK